MQRLLNCAQNRNQLNLKLLQLTS